MANNQGLTSKKIHVTSGVKLFDRLSELPDDVLLSIMSRLTMKEAAQLGTLSLKWRELWTCYPGIFNFEDSRIERDRLLLLHNQALVNQHISRFVSWVAQVVDQYRGSSMEEFNVAFALDNRYQSQLDKWVAFALAKGAKSLVLNFCDVYIISSTPSFYTPSLECCLPLKSVSLGIRKPCLKVLVLKHINISTEVLECILVSCPCLENLHICKSLCLTNIRVPSLPLALKQLVVTACRKLKTIEILAPSLTTFTYYGERLELHIRNASLLSEVTVGGPINAPIAYVLDSLSEYFSHLKYLCVMTNLYSEMNMSIHPLPNMTNLRHLRLAITARCSQTLLGWFTLIEASPVLQKLTLELSTFNGKGERPISLLFGERDNVQAQRPLKCLKILELFGFVGCRIDLELAKYVFENAVVLQQVIIDFKDYSRGGRITSGLLHLSMKRAEALRKSLAPSVEVIIN